MEQVTFTLDLGDCRAIFTGKVVGRLDQTNLVTYYNPMARQYQTVELIDRDIQSRLTTAAGVLPLFPVIEEPVSRPALINNLVSYSHSFLYAC